MNDKQNTQPKSVNWGGRKQDNAAQSVNWGGRALNVVVALALLLALLPPASAPAAAARAHPLLLQLAAEQPDERVRVIVQKNAAGARAEEQVAALGGEVTTDLRLINAFAAEVTAKDALQLARHTGVRWVSLDAPVVRSQASTLTVRDALNAPAYSNNDGTVGWTSDWIEIGENNGPTAGHVQITSFAYRDSQLVLRVREGTGAQRHVNLSGATSAVLSFDYSRANFDSWSDYATVEVSADDGASWTELDRLRGPRRDYNLRPARYDISGYISGNTAIRFVSSPSVSGSERLNLKNVQIEYAIGVGGAPSASTYRDTLNVQPVWDMGLQGQGVTVAVVDSGIAHDNDFGAAPTLELQPVDRVLLQLGFSPIAGVVDDTSGHGTHVAGIIGGGGVDSKGVYMGVAPRVNLISLRVSDDQGMAYESDTVAALQWIFENKDAYDIRVVNLSLNSTVEQSYHTSPLDAAVELLWFKGVVVVASVGNKGPDGGPNTANAAPANDPFIITAGASDEHGTPDPTDDSQAPFSAHGTTLDGFVKPDLLAPGKDIISVLSGSSNWANEYPDRVVLNGEYFRLSGTSMAAPMVSGAVALLLQAEPYLSPDQVKYRLMHTGKSIAPYAYLDVYAAVTTQTTESANAGVLPHQLLAKMALIAYWVSANGGGTIDWGTVDWNSVDWNSVDWNSVDWNSVDWNSIDWNSVDWNSVDWNSVDWNSVDWNSVDWNSVDWNSVDWSSDYWGD